MMKLTPYFSVETPPTVPGVYLTRRQEPGGVALWRAFDGKDWYYGIIQSVHFGSPSYTEAKKPGKIIKSVTIWDFQWRRATILDFRWQGLAEKP